MYIVQLNSPNLELCPFFSHKTWGILPGAPPFSVYNSCHMMSNIRWTSEIRIGSNSFVYIYFLPKLVLILCRTAKHIKDIQDIIYKDNI